MELNQDTFHRALTAYYSDTGSVEDGIRKAIEAYLTEMFKPGLMMTLEPLEAIPQRDYRKELWIGVATAVANGPNAVRNGVAFDRANEALAAFDKIFPKEYNHG